jgi:hypothetical protein
MYVEGRHRRYAPPFRRHAASDRCINAATGNNVVTPITYSVVIDIGASASLSKICINMRK